MSNDFYDQPADLAALTRARSGDINALADSVDAAFDKVPDELKLKRGTVNYAVTGGAADAYTVTLPYVPSGYVDGLLVNAYVHATNTGAATVNVNSLGVKSIKRQNGDTLIAGDLVKFVDIRYSTTTGFFHVHGSTAQSVADASASAAAALASQNASSSSASAAAASAAAALASLNDFKGRWYGPLSTDPTLDPLGAAIGIGDAYFNTSSNLLKIYNGATWQASDINTADLAASSGAGLIGFIDSAPGSVATTVQAWLRLQGNLASSIVFAASFGIYPGIGVDNTIGFAALATYFRNLTNTSRVVVMFPPGVFYTDSFEIPVPTTANVNGAFDLRGAGSNETIIIPRANAAASSVFGSISCSFTRGFNISGISLQGSPSNALQDGLAFYAETYPSGTAGGLSEGRFEDFNINGFTGRQCWMRGGAEDGLHPFQFIDFSNINFTRDAGVHFPCLETIGQFGQVTIVGQFNGADRFNNGGPNVVLSMDYRHQQLFPTAYDTSSHFITITNTGFLTQATNQYPSISGVRFIGSSLPTTSPQVALGTTYYMHKHNITGSTAVDTMFRLATSRANAASGTTITCSNQGTPASYSLVGLWADSLASNTFTTNEPHRLITADILSLVGANLPAGLSAATNYYVVRVSHFQFRLATSYANALAGTTISFSGGTLSDFGFLANGGAQSGLRSPYSIIGMPLTTQNSDTGIFLGSCGDAVLNIHSELNKKMIEAVGLNSCVTLIGGYQGFNSASDSGLGALGCFSGGGASRFNVSGAPHTQPGSVDTYYYAFNNAQVHVDPGCYAQTVAYAASITPPPVSCNLVIGTLTGNLTVSIPSGSIIPPNGSEITFNFTSDGSARTITWHVIYKLTTLTAASAANQKARVTFMSDGTNLVQISSTGWY